MVGTNFKTILWIVSFHEMWVRIIECENFVKFMGPTSNQNLSCFEHYRKIINPVLNDKKNLLKEIVWESQKWHFNFSTLKHISCIIDQNNILHDLINNSRTAQATKMIMPYLTSRTICFKITISFLKLWWFRGST